jgi:hypothetical protein
MVPVGVGKAAAARHDGLGLISGVSAEAAAVERPVAVLRAAGTPPVTESGQ